MARQKLLFGDDPNPPAPHVAWGEGRARDVKARKRKGQFFTPPEVVDFMFQLAGAREGWSAIDPACGDGAFLRGAVEAGCRPVVGVDLDAAALGEAEGQLGEAAALLEQDGLLPLPADERLGPLARGGFDLAIGNPPFAALRERVCDANVLSRFELGHRPDGRLHSKQVLEVLFVERFIQLARPGGRVCIIVPDGILANTRMRQVREFVLRATTVLAVVGLPRNTFRAASTQAKTSVLLLEKRALVREHDVGRGALLVHVPGSAGEGEDAFVASVESLDELPRVLAHLPARRS